MSKYLCLVLLVCSGCASVGNKVDPTTIANNYYSQERTYKTLELKGAKEISIKGDNVSLTVENQLQPLSLYPRDPSTLRTAFDGLARIGSVAAAAYVGKELADGLSRGPTVVNQPPPLLVRPEIVTIPGTPQ